VSIDDLWAGSLALPDVVLFATPPLDVSGRGFALALDQPTPAKRPFFIALVDPNTEVVDLHADLHLVKPLDKQFLEWILNRFRQVIMPPGAWPEHARRRDSAWRRNMCEV
jgi:hypothetical protein